MTAEVAQDWVDDFVRPDFHQVELDVETFLKKEKGWKLDAGECGRRASGQS